MVHRVVSDLFPDGSRLLRFVLADFVGRCLTTAWGDQLINYKDLCNLLGSVGAPSEGDEAACSVLSGVRMAVDALTEGTNRYTELRSMKEESLIQAAIHTSRGFGWRKQRPWVDRRMDEPEEEGRCAEDAMAGGSGEPMDRPFKSCNTTESKRLLRLKNKGSILLFTTVKTEAELVELTNDLEDIIAGRNKVIATLEDKSFIKLDHVNVFLLNVHPACDTVTVQDRALSKVSQHLSLSVRTCPADGEKLLIAVRATLLPLFDLVSTTVTGIPMKEEANASASVNYDVELLHERIAHSEIARAALLDCDPRTLMIGKEPEVIDVPDDDDDDPKDDEETKTLLAQKRELSKMLNSLLIEGQSSEEEERMRVNRKRLERTDSKYPGHLVAPAHCGSYATVRLTWATPSPKNAWNLFPRSRRAYPVTPALVNSRPSICLTSFLGQGKNVMLEVKNPPLARKLTDEEKSARAAERLQREDEEAREEEGKEKSEWPVVEATSSTTVSPAADSKKDSKEPVEYTDGLRHNFGDSRLITHTLVAHSGRIFIHEIALNPSTMPNDNEQGKSVCGIKAIPGLRLVDFGALMKEMMIVLPHDGDKDDKKAKKDESVPNLEARKRALRLTRYWPLKLTNSFIYNIPKKLEPLLSILRQPELSTADVDKCKQVFTTLLAYRESADLLTYTNFSSKLVKDMTSKDEQLRVALREVSAHMGNYVNHSERHAEVFKMWAQVSSEKSADRIPLTDVGSVTAKAKQLRFVRERVKKGMNWKETKRGKSKSSCPKHMAVARRRTRAVDDDELEEEAKEGEEKQEGEAAETGEKEVREESAVKGEESMDVDMEENVKKERMRHRPKEIRLPGLVKIRTYSSTMAANGGRNDRSRSRSPQPKRQRRQQLQWAPNETQSVLDWLTERQNPNVRAPRQEFVGRIKSGGAVHATLYEHLGNVQDLRPGKGMVEG